MFDHKVPAKNVSGRQRCGGARARQWHDRMGSPNCLHIAAYDVVEGEKIIMIVTNL